MIYIYTVLVRSLAMPEWNEWYVVVYMVGFTLEKLREVQTRLWDTQTLDTTLTLSPDSTTQLRQQSVWEGSERERESWFTQWCCSELLHSNTVSVTVTLWTDSHNVWPTILTVALMLQCCICRHLSLGTECIVAKRCVLEQSYYCRFLKHVSWASDVSAVACLW